MRRMMIMSFLGSFVMMLSEPGSGKSYGSNYKGKTELSAKPFELKGRIASTTWPDGTVIKHLTGSEAEVQACVRQWNMVKIYNQI